MLYLRTGLPGASKTLNTVKEVVEDELYTGTQVYYNNIKLLFLDLAVCYSFQGFFYGHYIPSLDDGMRRKYDLLIRKTHTAGDLVSLDDVLHLNAKFKVYMESSAPMDLFLHWCKKLYPAKKLKPLNDFYELTDDDLTLDVLKGFKLHWEHFQDPTDWHNLPNGSCIVIDECQEFFSQLSPSATRPQHYTKFATHRHKGVDIHLVTQNEKFIDSRVRNLAHRHIHYYNKFGGKRLFRVENSMVFDSASRHEVAAFPSELIKRDSNYYGVYWSADVHTHKLRIPKKLVVWSGIAVVALFGCLYFLYSGYSSFYGADKGLSAATGGSVTSGSYAVATQNAAGGVFLPHGFKGFAHPLNGLCESISYAGHSVVGKSDVYEVEHFFNCETGKTEKAGGDVFKGDDDKEGERSYAQAVLYSARELALVGYELGGDKSFIFLEYAGNKIAFSRQ